MRACHFGFIAATALLVSACGSESSSNPTQGKGAEDDELIDGKMDSFYTPTMHGDLAFGTPNTATITSDERFHAWTFTLSGEASVELRTEVTNNLDTVMYLYRRADGASSWGSYIAKNDDHGGNIWSQISKTLDGGEYRVVVKAFKAAMLGPFAVQGTCAGDGCPEQAACSSDPYPMRALTGYAPSCAGKLHDVLTTPVTSQQSRSVAVGDCSFGPQIKKAVDYYREYWDDMMGWADFADCGDDQQCLDEVMLDVGLTELGSGGALADVDIGGDESAMTFVFDAGGDLLMYYQHNQSPDMGWACADAGEPSADQPGDDCAAMTLAGVPHKPSGVTSKTGETSVDTAEADIGAPAKAALVEFASQQQLDGAEIVQYSLSSWKSISDYDGVAVELTHGSVSAAYDVVSSDYGGTIVMQHDADGASFLCKDLP